LIPADWLSGAFGVASAAAWGAADFWGGLATKRVALLPVVIGSQLVGLVTLLSAAILFGDPLPATSSLLWCGVAGVCGAIGLLALYKALSMGRMGLAAPVSGVLCAAIPVVASGAVDGMPGWLRLLGFALALVGVWLVAQGEGADFHIKDLGLPIVAGVGFGCFVIIISWSSKQSVFWPLVATRLASLSVLALVAAFTRQQPVPPVNAFPLIAAAGVADAGGNVFLVLAAHAGRLDVAAVLSSLYPATTVLLAWLILHERVSRWQFAGLVAVLSAIVLITLR
jgi:drug/metabolite transporter (DMT)-like permease